MKIINRIIIVAVLMVAGFACTDLEEELKADFTEGFEPNNQGFGESENVNGSLPNDGLNAAYNRLRDGSAGHSSYFSVAEISTDEVVITQKGGDWFDGGIWLNMHKHDFRDTNPGLTNAWNNLYGGVTQCNDLLAAGGLSTDQTAQLRAVRAFFFLRLIDMFGNVKLTTTNGVDQAQATRAEAFAFIESEVLAAIPDLGVGRVYGRFNQSVGYAMLARLYLNAEVYAGTPRWQDAIDAADMVINSGLYDLDPEYANVFSPSNVDNIEHIYAIPYDEATGTGMNFAQMTLHYPSQLTYDLQQQPWNGYSTLEEFYNSYDDADVRKAANFIAGPQADINGNPILDVAFDPADPDGAAINYTPFINELAPSGSRQGGARMGKYSFKVGQLPEMDNDYTLFRYGELLLVKAEAQSRLAGDWNAGIDLVNQVRTRAGMPAYTALTGEEFYAERGREVFQESLRRTDMIRFDTWGNAWWEKPAHSDAFKNIMPIPLEQINASLNGDIALIQNPGY